MNNKDEIIKQMIELEEEALATYLDFQGIAIKDYVNAEIMGVLEYQKYVDMYYQIYKQCVECEQEPCDEGCPYQVSKKRRIQMTKDQIEIRNELEKLIVEAKLQIADDCISRHNTSLIDYMGKDDHSNFLDLWKQVYDECYFCGNDDVNCKCFSNNLEEKEETNEQ